MKQLRLRWVLEFAQDARDGWQVSATSLWMALLIAALSRRTFQIDRDACAGALSNNGEPLNLPPMTAYRFNRQIP